MLIEKLLGLIGAGMTGRRCPAPCGGTGQRFDLDQSRGLLSLSMRRRTSAYSQTPHAAHALASTTITTKTLVSIVSLLDLISAGVTGRPGNAPGFDLSDREGGVRGSP
jgi:hypothetical protein